MGYQIGVIAGDGIGPEVVAEGLKVVAAAGVDLDLTTYDLGGARYLRTGEVLPDSVLDEIRKQDAVLLGAVGTPDVPPGVLERGLLLKLRFDLDLYVNLRPVKLLPGAVTPLANRTSEDIDMLVIRENTEGVYIGEGNFSAKDTPEEVANQNSVNTRRGVERIVRYAFEATRQRERKQLTLVHKTNVMTFAGDLWQRTFNEVAALYPDIKTDYCHVDAACLYFVEQPQRFDVIVTENMFGDIITDLGAAITGGMGLAASGNIDPERRGPSIFEPVHGSAPDIAGTGKANPLGAVLSTSMMLNFLGEQQVAGRIESAVGAVLEKLGDTTAATTTHTTSEIGDMVAEQVTKEG